MHVVYYVRYPRVQEHNSMDGIDRWKGIIIRYYDYDGNWIIVDDNDWYMI